MVLAKRFRTALQELRTWLQHQQHGTAQLPERLRGKARATEGGEEIKGGDRGWKRKCRKLLNTKSDPSSKREKYPKLHMVPKTLLNPKEGGDWGGAGPDSSAQHVSSSSHLSSSSVHPQSTATYGATMDSAIRKATVDERDEFLEVCDRGDVSEALRRQWDFVDRGVALHLKATERLCHALTENLHLEISERKRIKAGEKPSDPAAHEEDGSDSKGEGGERVGGEVAATPASTAMPIDIAFEAERLFAYINAAGDAYCKQMSYGMLVRAYLVEGKEEAATALVKDLESSSSLRAQSLRRDLRAVDRRKMIRRCKRELIRFYTRKGSVSAFQRVGELLRDGGSTQLTPSALHTVCIEALSHMPPLRYDDLAGGGCSEVLGELLGHLKSNGFQLPFRDAVSIAQQWMGEKGPPQIISEVEPPPLQGRAVDGERGGEMDRRWRKAQSALYFTPPSPAAAGAGGYLKNAADNGEHGFSPTPLPPWDLSPAVLYSRRQEEAERGDQRDGWQHDHWCSCPLRPLFLDNATKTMARQLIKAELGRTTASESRDRVLQELENIVASQHVSVVVDTANVAYHRQNFLGGQFSYRQVEAVRQMLLDEGESPLLIMNPRYLNLDGHEIRFRPNVAKQSQKAAEEEDPNGNAKKILTLTDEDRAIIEAWKADGHVFKTLEHVNDDLFWLYATLLESSEESKWQLESVVEQGIEKKKEDHVVCSSSGGGGGGDSFAGGKRRGLIEVVSNDRMRDHRRFIFPDASKSQEQKAFRELAKWQAQQIRFNLIDQPSSDANETLPARSRNDGRFIAPNGVAVLLQRTPSFYREAQVFEIESPAAEGWQEWHFPVTLRDGELEKLMVPQAEGGEEEEAIQTWRHVSSRHYEETTGEDLWLKLLIQKR